MDIPAKEVVKASSIPFNNSELDDSNSSDDLDTESKLMSCKPRKIPKKVPRIPSAVNKVGAK